MGVLTDIVIAKTSDANTLTEQLCNQEFVSEDNKGLLIEMLFMLYSILDDRPMSQELSEEFLLLSAEDIDDGPWAYKIPDPLVTMLSQIEGDKLSEIADLWADTVRAQNLEFVNDSSIKLCREYLESLRRLSIEALARRESLFLRVCL